MTVRELYKWAKHNDALDYDIEIQYRDGEGLHYGVDECEPELLTRGLDYHSEIVVLL